MVQPMPEGTSWVSVLEVMGGPCRFGCEVGVRGEAGALDGENLERKGPGRDWPEEGTMAPRAGKAWKVPCDFLGNPCGWSSNVLSWPPGSPGTPSSEVQTLPPSGGARARPVAPRGLVVSG